MQQPELIYTNQTNRFMDCKYRVLIPASGRAELFFDTGNFTDYSVFVYNASTLPMTGLLQLYPERNVYYTDTFSEQQINPLQTQLFIGRIIVKQTSLVLIGSPNQEAFVFLQGQF